MVVEFTRFRGQTLDWTYHESRAVIEDVHDVFLRLREENTAI
jgi:hypothetical protein